MKKALLLILFISSFCQFAKADSAVTYGNIEDSTNTLFLKNEWKFNPTDNLAWALPSTNDSSWKTTNSNFSIDEMDALHFNGIGWFRIKININKEQLSKTYALLLSQEGASELYLNGKLIKSFGRPSIDKTKEIKYTPSGRPLILKFDSIGEYILAVRYSNSNAKQMQSDYLEEEAGFSISIKEANIALEETTSNILAISSLFSFLFAFFATISFIHLLLFLFYRSKKTNLFYSIFIFLFSTFFILAQLIFTEQDPEFENKLVFLLLFITPVFFASLLGFIYSLFYEKIPRLFWIVLGILILILALKLLRLEPGIVSFSYICAVTIISAIEVIRAFINKKRGAWAIGIAATSFILLILLLLLKNALGFGTGFSIEGDAPGGFFLFSLLIIAILGIPVSMSVFLAREFSTTSKSLSKKLIEVEELSAKSIEQEKEKQKILETQNEVLEVQVKERTSEIEEQKKLIEEKNKDITDSINYAKRIQDAILPEQPSLNKLFIDSFILFKPKDIVSGDFYWFAEHNGIKIIAVADCTGHGVPGALMSMIGSNILNKLVLEKGITQPDLILNELNEEVRTALKQKESTSETRDGMDIAIITISKNQLQYAGAHRPLYIINQMDIQEIKANKFSIGGIQQEEKRVFTNHILTLQNNTTFYLSSDGFADQFGGLNGKKLMTKTFKELLINIQNQKMNEQKEFLNETIESWKGSREQVDDILVIGIRI